MFYTDRPIVSKNEDLLNRDHFTYSLAKAITSYGSKESLSIGLLGKWGSGKTSIINMMIDNIKQIDNVIIPKFKIIEFNPWYFSDQNQLISQFFAQLSFTLKHNNLGKEAKKIAKKIEYYSKLLKPIELIPGMGQYAVMAKLFAKNTSEILDSYAKQKETNVQGLYDELKKLLANQNFKLIIIIDDIDRLTNTEIRQVFQLVKAIADFPNVIYILSFDKDVVVSALAKVQSGSGYDYLEKVIQVSFDVPKINEEDILGYLSRQLESTIGQIFDQRWNANYWSNVYLDGFKYFFKDLRDVQRFINTLKLSYDLIGHEVNLVDLFSITAIQVFIPELYQSILNNKTLFLSEFDSNILSNDEVIKELSAKYNQIIAGIDYLPENYLSRFLARIFPKLNALSSSRNFGVNDPENNWLKDLRLCSPEHFDKYFRLCLAQNEISFSEISELINSTKSIELLSQKVIGFTDNGKITRLLERLEDYTNEEIPLEDIENVISVLMNLGDSFPVDEGFYAINKHEKIWRICKRLLLRVDKKEDRYTIIRNAIRFSKESIYTIVFEVSSQASEHGKYDPNKLEEQDQTTTLELVGELEKLAVQKLRRWVRDGRLNNHPKLISILFHWQNIGEADEIRKYVNVLVKTNKGLISFIRGFTGKSRSFGAGDYVAKESIKLNTTDIGKFIDNHRITFRLRKIKNSKQFYRYSSEEQNTIILYLDTIDGKIKSRF